MKSTITETELRRRLGDVLARIRYRRESFIIVERSGRSVARMVPIEGESTSLREALVAWLIDGDADASFADDLAGVNAADRPAASPWAS
jgi:antitoxin (DNA-binding transcriptional repressor) of toxin-antitoxin stability system